MKRYPAIISVVLAIGSAVVLWLTVVPLTPDAAMAQDQPAGASRSQSELLWHKSSALFPIKVYLPEGFDSTQTYPAVIALHGFGGSSEGFEGIAKAFAQAGFLTAVPEGPYPVPSTDPGRHSSWELSTWATPPLSEDPAIQLRSAEVTVLEFLPSVIDRIEQRYHVGPLYVFGFSHGGVYALIGGVYNHDRFNGVIAFGVRGFQKEWFTHRGGSLEDGNNLAVRLVQGRSDPMVPFSEAERARDLLKEAGYKVTLDEFACGHAVPEDALGRAVTWLREQVDAQ